MSAVAASTAIRPCSMLQCRQAKTARFSAAAGSLSRLVSIGAARHKPAARILMPVRSLRTLLAKARILACCKLFAVCRVRRNRPWRGPAIARGDKLADRRMIFYYTLITRRKEQIYSLYICKNSHSLPIGCSGPASASAPRRGEGIGFPLTEIRTEYGDLAKARIAALTCRD